MRARQSLFAGPEFDWCPAVPADPVGRPPKSSKKRPKTRRAKKSKFPWGKVALVAGGALAGIVIYRWATREKEDQSSMPASPSKQPDKAPGQASPSSAGPSCEQILMPEMPLPRPPHSASPTDGCLGAKLQVKEQPTATQAHTSSVVAMKEPVKMPLDNKGHTSDVPPQVGPLPTGTTEAVPGRRYQLGKGIRQPFSFRGLFLTVSNLALLVIAHRGSRPGSRRQPPSAPGRWNPVRRRMEFPTDSAPLPWRPGGPAQPQAQAGARTPGTSSSNRDRPAKPIVPPLAKAEGAPLVENHDRTKVPLG